MPAGPTSKINTETTLSQEERKSTRSASEVGGLASLGRVLASGAARAVGYVPGAVKGTVGTRRALQAIGRVDGSERGRVGTSLA